jgi:hypothetical protein
MFCEDLKSAIYSEFDIPEWPESEESESSCITFEILAPEIRLSSGIVMQLHCVHL